MPERTILLIDYDPESIEETRRALAGSGFRLEVAHDGLEGLSAFERLRPDLVMIEPMVPKKHGFQVCQEIKRTERGKDVPVVITTAFYKSRKHRNEAQDRYGCDDYLIKPVGQELLLATFRKFLSVPQAQTMPVEGEVVINAAMTALPWAPAREKLPALDELSDDELGARLDEMILEDPEEEPVSVAVASTSECEPARTEVSPVEGVAASASSGAIAVASLPVGAGETPERVVTPQVGVVAPPVELRDVPARAAPQGIAVSDAPAEVGETQKPVKRLPDGTATAVAGSAPVSGRTTPSIGRFDEGKILSDSPVRSKTPIWIAVAGVALIAIGGGILWMLGRTAGDGSVGQPGLVAASTATSGGERLPTSVSDVPSSGTPELAQPEVRDTGLETADPIEPVVGSQVETVPPPPEPSRAEVRTEQPSRPVDPVPQPSPPVASRATTEDRPASTDDTTGPSQPASEASSPEPVAAVPATERNDENVGAVPPPLALSPTEMTATETLGAAESFDPVSTTNPDSEDNSIAGPELDSPGPPDSIEAAGSEVVPPDSTETSGFDVSGSEVVPSSRPAPTEVSPPTAAPAVERGQLVPLDEVDRRPEPLARPTPAYPSIARRLRLQGTVVLRLLVDENGKVIDVDVEQGVDGRVLDRAAIDAVKTWRYAPAEKAGVEVRVWIPERVSFKL